MPERYDRTTSAAAQEVALRVVRDNTYSGAPAVSERRVIRRLVAEGFSREQARRALQMLVVTDSVRIEDDRVRPTR